MFRHLALANLILGAAIAFATTVATAPAALASTYLLSFSSAGGDVGSLQVGLNGTTAIWASGSINGFAITGLSSYAGADQQFFVAGPVHFTVPGLSFSASNGTLYNLTAYPPPDNCAEVYLQTSVVPCAMFTANQHLGHAAVGDGALFALRPRLSGSPC